MVNDEQEITIELNCTYEQAHDILIKNECELIEEYILDDIYMLKNSCNEIDPIKMLDECVLIRNFIFEKECIKQLVVKEKTYNNKGEILKQSKTSCDIKSVKETHEFLEKIGYHDLINIKDYIKVYKYQEIEFVLQIVNEKHLYLELENRNNVIDFISYAKKIISQLKVPQKDNGYFVKKAVIEIIERQEKNKKGSNL